MNRLLLILLVITTLSSASLYDGKLLVQPFQEFNQQYIDTLKSAIEANYGFEVSVAKPILLPESAFTNIKTPRYRADSILRYLNRNRPDSIDYVLALTTKDISFTKKDAGGVVKSPGWKYLDWGIIGLGNRPGACAVVSTFRLGDSTKSLFQERFLKVCQHEIGHNLGLKHCTYSTKCVMRDAAETVKTIDELDAKLCYACRKKLELK